MAADGNEAVKLSQLKDIYKVASDTSYGVVRLVSDEVLNALVSGASSVKPGTFELEASNYISSYGNTVSGTLSNNGKVTISGSFSPSRYIDVNTTLFTIPEGYRPQRTVYFDFEGGYYDYSYRVNVGTDGKIKTPADGNMTQGETWTMSGTYTIDMPEQVEVDVPEAAVITVQQLKMLVDGSSGSGGSANNNEEVLFNDITGGDGEYITINKNLDLYSKIVVTFSNGTSNNITDELIVTDRMIGQNTNASSTNSWFHVWRDTAYDNEFDIFPDVPNPIIKVVGIKR